MRLIRSTELLDVITGAQYLLGCEIVRTLKNKSVLRARIVEVESYHQEDPASHTFHGKSARNEAMFGPAGHAYIYFTYGMHWCFNVTAGPEGYGAGILVRAAEPIENMLIMQQKRSLQTSSAQSVKTLHNTTNGPAKLAQALAIDKRFYGHNLSQPPLQIFEPKERNFKMTQTTRIGISKATDEVARFYITDNPFVSRK